MANQKLTADQRNAFIASFLGWTMDPFDYFLVVLVYADIAKDFHTLLQKVAFITAGGGNTGGGTGHAHLL